jgi:MoaA/NifB/PqqE/SkfB family radical SAM enzyme
MGKARFFAVADAARVLRETHDAGIRTSLFLLTGFPGETPEESAMTVAFLRENARWIDQVKSINSIHVITGAPLHVHAETFGLELPEKDYHYLWTTRDGSNTPEERNRRTREILRACNELGIEVLETNLAEGKQYDLAAKVTAGDLSPDEQVKVLLAQVNKLESFDVEGGALRTPELAARERIDLSADALAASALARSREGCAPVVAAPPADEPSPFIMENRDLVGFADGEKPYAGPRILEIDLTNNCNLNCAGCWCHSDLLREKKVKGEKKRRMLGYDLIRRLVEEAAAMGVERVQIAGAGEPFVHPKIMEIIAAIKARGMKVTIVTNFTLVDKKKAEKLVELGVDNLTCSVWAGTPEVYARTHPNQSGKRLHQIGEVLRHLHAAKKERGTPYPHVKLYNVISRLNADGITDMVTFATKSLADYVEFTPIDIVRGYTDELALTAEDRASIVRQLNDLPKHPDYIELDPNQSAVRAEATAHGKEFARFIQRDALLPGFRYELDDIRRFDVVCPRKEWRLDIREDNVAENALLFFYPKHECERCPIAKECAIDKERHVVKVGFTSFLGFGAFFRRISAETSASGTYDAGIVNDLPCYVGWTYARVLTTGDVIPCCKADKVSMGNLNERSFRAIWTAPEYDVFRSKAKTLPKTDDYFAAIRCLDACDNLGMNVASDEKWKGITDDQRAEVRGWVGSEKLLLRPPEK